MNDYSAGFAAGLEAAAKLAENFRIDYRFSDHYQHGASMAAGLIAVAIRAHGKAFADTQEAKTTASVATD